MKILISGALGYMGREVARQAQSEGIQVVCGVDVAQGQADFPIYTDFAQIPSETEVDVIVDFSSPAVLDGLLTWALARKVPAVLATTGYREEQLDQLDEAAKQIPLFRSGNMSLGVAVLQALSRKAAQILGDSFDVEIVEAHHNRKVDAPSGTALMLLDAVKAGLGTTYEAQFGRHGRDCKRKAEEIGVHSLRGGTVTGEHEVCFFGPSERVTLHHTAENRSVFAVGALRAAAFLREKSPRIYNMEDLVGKL